MSPAGSDGANPPPVIPDNAAPPSILGNFFWQVWILRVLSANKTYLIPCRFGRILSIRINDKTAHVQWFHHGCQTILQELANPQELYLSPSCGEVELAHVVGKAKVKKYDLGLRPKRFRHDEYFYGYVRYQL